MRIHPAPGRLEANGSFGIIRRTDQPCGATGEQLDGDTIAIGFFKSGIICGDSCRDKIGPRVNIMAAVRR
jgi:hypothetical protein